MQLQWIGLCQVVGIGNPNQLHLESAIVFSNIFNVFRSFLKWYFNDVRFIYIVWTFKIMQISVFGASSRTWRLRIQEVKPVCSSTPWSVLRVFFGATWIIMNLQKTTYPHRFEAFFQVCLSRIRLHKSKSALAMVHAALSSSNAWGWKLKWSNTSTSIAFYGTTNSNCKKLCAFNLAHNWYIQLIINPYTVNPNLSSYWGSYSWLFPFPARVKTEQNCLRRRRTVHSHIL